MRFKFTSTRLSRLYGKRKDAGKCPPGVVDAFFEVMAVIKAARDERDLRALNGLRYEKLKGVRGNRRERSLRLTGQYRLIVVPSRDKDGRFLSIADIVDYH